VDVQRTHARQALRAEAERVRQSEGFRRSAQLDAQVARLQQLSESAGLNTSFGLGDEASIDRRYNVRSALRDEKLWTSAFFPHTESGEDHPDAGRERAGVSEHVRDFLGVSGGEELPQEMRAAAEVREGALRVMRAALVRNEHAGQEANRWLVFSPWEALRFTQAALADSVLHALAAGAKFVTNVGPVSDRDLSKTDEHFLVI
jgi:hypothetical protein